MPQPLQDHMYVLCVCMFSIYVYIYIYIYIYTYMHSQMSAVGGCIYMHILQVLLLVVTGGEGHVISLVNVPHM